MGWILLIIVIVAIIWIVGIYNNLVAGRNRFKNAFAQIDVQLTRRYDLIPNLVEVAKGYLKHERETLEAVISARNSAVSGLKAAASDPGSAAAVQQLAGAESQLGGALGRRSGRVRERGALPRTGRSHRASTFSRWTSPC